MQLSGSRATSETEVGTCEGANCCHSEMSFRRIDRAYRDLDSRQLTGGDPDAPLGRNKMEDGS